MERSNPAHRNGQVYQEACEWFVEFRLGEPDDTARRAFHAWLKESPAHMGAYLDVSANWTRVAAIDVGARWSKEQLIEDARRDTQSVVTLCAARTAPSAQAAQSRFSSTRRRRLVCAAALAAVSLIGCVLWVNQDPRYSTGTGEQRSLALSDGSTVQLDSLSKIRIRYTEHERSVELLKGQALFHVAKDSTRPFIVHSGQTSVRAVGTQFDVRRNDSDAGTPEFLSHERATTTVVTVVEGRVAVFPEREANNVRTSHANEGRPAALEIEGVRNPVPGNKIPADIAQRAGEAAIVLTAGEQITVSPDATHKSLHPNLAGATAWTQRQLVFDATPLSEVAEEFNRYNERQLRIRDPSLLGFQIDGVFSSTDLASLLRFLRERPEMRVTETEIDIIVTRQPVRNDE